MVKRSIKGLRAALLLALVVLTMACVHGGSVAGALDGAWLDGARIKRAPTVPLLKCESDAFRIDLLDAIDAIPDDTLEAQREQLRDWIWTVTLGRVAQKTSVDDVFSGVMDQPLMRDDTLAHVLRLPVGPTRAATTKKGEVVVLVEAAGDAAMAAAVLEAIDDEALSLGRTPEQVQVYGYELKPSVAEASVCKIGGFDREKLESAAQAYRSATVTTAADLDQFLSGGVDLLSAQCTPSGLEVAGRQRPRNTRANVTVEHVAALAQELGARYIPPARFGVTLDTLPREEREDLEAFARDFDAERAQGRLTQKQLRADPKLSDEKKKFLSSALAWKEANLAVPTTEILLSLRLQRQFDGQPGFSLDPVTTAEAATKSLDELIGALSLVHRAGRAGADLEKLVSLLHAWGDDRTAKSIRSANPGVNTLWEVRVTLEQVRARLQRARDEDVKAILWSPPPKDSFGAAVVSALMWSVDVHSGQQCARYDGPLSGTETGMTFFYTDLLAKFWARGWKGVSPEGEVDGFESVVHHVGSTAWCGEDDRPFTRIWFGVRDEGYARERSGGVRFAPMAARVFARGSTPGSGEAEVEPNASYRRFILWWDRHYARLADWEPQYEVLNQLMKWSVVTQSARIAGAPSCLRFLQGVHVKNDHRFDRWVAETRDLRWRGPVNLVPAPQKATECLPLITSEPFRSCGGEWSLTGGVSAGSLKQVDAKALRSAEIPVGLGRFGAESKPITVEPNRLRFNELNRSGGKLHGVEIEGGGDRATFKANIDTVASQRGSLSSSDPRTPINTTAKIIERNGKELAFQQRNNELLDTGLKLSDLGRADVRVEVKSGPIGQGKVVAKKVADRMAHDGVSLQDAASKLGPGSEVFFLDDGKVAVRLGEDGGQKFCAIMESGGGNRGPPGVTAGIVVGRPEGGSYGPWKGRGGPNEPLRVWIAPEKDVTSYIIHERHSKRLMARDGTLDAVNEKLVGGDRAAAMEAFERRPTPSAAERLLQSAVEQPDMSSAERVITRMSKGGSAEDLAGMKRILDKQSVLVERKGSDPSELAQLSARLSIEHRMRRMPGASENDAIRTLGQRLPEYRPTTYSPEGGLPPAVHPRGTPLRPSERWVRRIIEIEADLELPRTFKKANGIDFKLLGAPRETPNDLRRTASNVGSASRLLAPTRRIVIVSACSDTDENMPPCHEPPSGENREMLEKIKRKLCDQDSDGALSTPAERACLAEMGKCDQDGDGVWSTSEEGACLAALRKQSP